MRFQIRTDRNIVVIFEPTGMRYELEAGDYFTIEWPDSSESGIIEREGADLIVYAPMLGYTRAWNSIEEELYIGH